MLQRFILLSIRKVFGEYFRAAGAEFTGISYFNGLVNTSSIWYYIKKV
ncbi:hypothetical protein COPEUT_01652 [Coprococcus eutactus ATCC 27759]|nr:hypothetical protein COPEUT_01652 [Coprococcus eutactus ATCC 27759]